MKTVHLLSLCACFALIACAGRGSKAIYHPDVGPFDENGDYIAALADAPVKKNYFSRRKPKAASQPKRAKASKPAKTQRIAKVTPPTPAPRVAPQPVRPPQVAAPRTVVIAQSPRPRPAVSRPRPAPKPAVAPKPRPKPKPKAVVVKPKKKAPVRHVVRRSDTLFGLSRRYGTSVKSIQRANNLRGTTIITGKTLIIPR